MRGIGTSEPWVTEEMSAMFGMAAISVHYRRPLSIMEVAKLGRTTETLLRPGRS